RRQILDLDEALRLAPPGQQQRGDVLAMPAVTDRAGALGLQDPAILGQRRLHAIGFGDRAAAERLERVALPAGADDAAFVGVRLAARETPLVDVVEDIVVAEVARVEHAALLSSGGACI